MDYLNRLGGRCEAGLLVPGLGLEHFLDLLQDTKDAQAGLTGGTPRTIEGPLYVAGAPICEGEARMDDDSELDRATVMFLDGVVRDAQGRPAPWSTCGTPTPRATTPTSTRASPPTTCALEKMVLQHAIVTLSRPLCRLFCVRLGSADKIGG